jgi:3-hydroxyisobutyrate dehydrogenase-like beta-hydroxyacid dehydrogenase
MNQIGVIGLGKMGMPIVRHLLAHHFDVIVYDTNAQRLQEAVCLGAQSIGSPKDMAHAADMVIIIVGFDPEVIDVFESANGLIFGAHSGLVIAIASTVSIETMKYLDEKAKSLPVNIDILDIPLCRGEPAAENGTLLLMAGGSATVYEKSKAIFETFASDCYFLGPLGSGQVGKMINNLLLWACVSANYEGLKLGSALGVNEHILRNALLKSSGANWALDTWPQPRPMPWAEKDMSIIMQEADHARLSLPLCGVVREVIKAIKIERGLTAPQRMTPT